MTTPIGGLRKPSLGDNPNGPLAIGNLADDVDDQLHPRFASTAARDSAITAPVNGMVCWVTGVGQMTYVNGWRNFGGIWAHAIATNSFPADDTETRITGASNWTGTLIAGRLYRVDGQGLVSSSVDGNTPEIRLRGVRGGTPSNTSPILASDYKTVASSSRPQTWKLFGTFGVTVTGTHTMGLFLRRFGGSGTVSVGPSGSGVFEYTLTDVGPTTLGAPLIP